MYKNTHTLLYKKHTKLPYNLFHSFPGAFEMFIYGIGFFLTNVTQIQKTKHILFPNYRLCT